MTKPVFYVDFNEMLESDLVLLSATDIKVDLDGKSVHLNEGLEITVFMEDENEQGHPDNLVATGTVEVNDGLGWSSHVKWCCRIDARGTRHQSELSA
jgi:hypothetical protein